MKDKDYRILSINTKNVSQVGYIAALISLTALAADIKLKPESALYFTSLRVLSACVLVLGTYLVRKEKVRAHNFFLFCWVYPLVLTITAASVELGGFSSEYYAGLMLVLFAFTVFINMSVKDVILVDVIFILTFFVGNYIWGDHDVAGLTRSLSNILSFTALKFVVVRNNILAVDRHIESALLRREIKDQHNIRKMSGELCHEINNPLHVCMNIIKKVQKANDQDEYIRDQLDRAIQSGERIHSVTKKLMRVNRDQSELKQ